MLAKEVGLDSGGMDVLEAWNAVSVLISGGILIACRLDLDKSLIFMPFFILL